MGPTGRPSVTRANQRCHAVASRGARWPLRRFRQFELEQRTAKRNIIPAPRWAGGIFMPDVLAGIENHCNRTSAMVTYRVPDPTETSGRASWSTKSRRPIQKSRRRCRHDVSRREIRRSGVRAHYVLGKAAARGMSGCVSVVRVVDAPDRIRSASGSRHSPTPIALWGQGRRQIAGSRKTLRRPGRSGLSVRRGMLR